MALRFDPKTRRVIVSDLTPSVKGEIVTLQEYADNIAWSFKQINATLEIQQKTLGAILLCLSSMSGINITKEDL